MNSVVPNSTAPVRKRTLTTEARQALEMIRSDWGIADFRPLQAESILAQLDRRDLLCVLPTGSGKSLCFQAPPRFCDDFTVVISPLLALQKDQVDKLASVGVPATRLNCQIDPITYGQIQRDCVAGKYRLLYVAPETFTKPEFLTFLTRCKVASVVIDEAHCISQWGHEFRPDYRKLDCIRKVLPKASIAAFTATATTAVRTDIIKHLGLRDSEVLVGDVDRPNLIYRIVRRTNLEKQVLAYLTHSPFARTLNSGLSTPHSGIIYCPRRADTEYLADYLRHFGINASAYHAGMDDELRAGVQDDFMDGKLDVICATIAFGMGIDRPDVRFVLHTCMPSSLEGYHQETGRAGRDGQPAECVMFYRDEDADIWKERIESGVAPQRFYWFASVDEMQEFATGDTCRHAALARYFDQPHPGRCSACDVCLTVAPVRLDGGIAFP